MLSCVLLWSLDCLSSFDGEFLTSLVVFDLLITQSISMVWFGSSCCVLAVLLFEMGGSAVVFRSFLNVLGISVLGC